MPVGCICCDCAQASVFKRQSPIHCGL